MGLIFHEELYTVLIRMYVVHLPVSFFKSEQSRPLEVTKDFDVLRKGTQFEISMLMCVWGGNGCVPARNCMHVIVWM